jgi:hypothetical protein
MEFRRTNSYDFIFPIDKSKFHARVMQVWHRAIKLPTLRKVVSGVLFFLSFPGSILEEMKCLVVIALLVSVFGLGTSTPVQSSPATSHTSQLNNHGSRITNQDIIIVKGDDGYHPVDDPTGDGGDKSIQVFDYPHGDLPVAVVLTSHVERTISAGGGYTVQDYTIHVEIALKDDGTLHVRFSILSFLVTPYRRYDVTPYLNRLVPNSVVRQWQLAQGL